MAQPQTSTERKTQLWSDRIASWKQSGLTQRAYCEQHQLDYSTFAYWRGRLKKLQTVQEEEGKVNFIPVTLKQKKPTVLTLRINDRHSIDINGKRPVICIFFSSPQSTMMEPAFIILVWRRAHGAVTQERRVQTKDLV